MSEQKMKRWLENIYNCPYLILIAVSSVIAMFSFDEIGVRIFEHPVSEERTVSVVGDIVRAEENQTLGELSVALEEVQNTDVQDAEMQELLLENEQAEAENAGERKTGTDEIENNEELNIEIIGPDMVERPEKIVRGTTKFQEYEPVETNSIYYSDAGKVALTTEYPYVLEDDSYFNDAAFLGDSRTLGIFDYAGLDGADFFCDNGMTIFKLFSDKGVTEQKTGQKVNLKNVFQERSYGKVYIMLGMNELGYGNTTMYFKEYLSVVKQIREWQPEAVIFVMANLHVSRAKNNLETEFNNININAKNAASARIANGTDIFYLDSNPLFTDSEGFLPSDWTFDGVHLYAQHYDKWRQFLLEHGVERENASADAATGVEGGDAVVEPQPDIADENIIGVQTAPASVNPLDGWSDVGGDIPGEGAE